MDTTNGLTLWKDFVPSPGSGHRVIVKLNTNLLSCGILNLSSQRENTPYPDSLFSVELEWNAWKEKPSLVSLQVSLFFERSDYDGLTGVWALVRRNTPTG